MKFKAGDGIDNDLCTALKHEFLRCEDAFKEFEIFAIAMITKGRNRWLSYKAYNAYARFVQHLYEFMGGCYKRDSGNTEIANKTSKEKAEILEDYITFHEQRILDNRREAISKGTAPIWENDISYYPERPPINFAKEFRQYRNKLCGHVSYERSSKLSLSEFFSKYHKYLYILYQDSVHMWGRKGDGFPDLKEITDFSVLIKRNNIYK